jgi:hypothetical protein
MKGAESMPYLEETRYIERMQFFDGQRLFADDLQALEAFHREMRWQHNRSLHQPGIGNGYAVRGEKGDRVITVCPGYAIDAEGREIMLNQDEEIQVPPVSGEPDGRPAYYDLVISYPSDEDLEETETRAGVCLPRDAVRLREKPVFCWVHLRLTESGYLLAEDTKLRREIESGMRLTVARAEVQNCQLKRSLSVAQRRNARPAKSPHIAGGEHAPHSWDAFWLISREELRAALVELFQPQALQSPAMLLSARGFRPFYGSLQLGAIGPIILPLGLRTTVSTADACFRAVPSYDVRLGGRRIVPVDLLQFLVKLGLIDPDDGQIRDLLAKLKEMALDLHLSFFVEGLPAVRDARPDRFTVRLALMVQLIDLPDLRLIEALSEPETRKLLQAHVQAQLMKLPIAEKLASCAAEAGDKKQTCLGEAADMVLDMVAKLFEAIFASLGWSITWIGVEG